MPRKNAKTDADAKPKRKAPAKRSKPVSRVSRVRSPARGGRGR